jgi:hypothetical protein
MVLRRILGNNALGVVAAQAVVTEAACGRLGVAWSDPKSDKLSTSAMARRAASGAAYTLVLTLAALGVARLLGKHVSAGEGSLTGVGVALLSAGFLALRGEVLEHGLLLTLLPRERVLLCVAVGALASAAVFLGLDKPANFWEPLSHAAVGGLTMLIWLQQRGAWAAWGARTAYLFLGQTGAAGSVLDVEPGVGLGGLPSTTALICAFAAFLLWRPLFANGPDKTVTQA